MITQWVINHEAYTPALPLTREVFIFVGAMHGEPIPTTYPKRAMFPTFQECYNLWCLSGRQPLLAFYLPCCRESGHWWVVYSRAVWDVHVYGAWPGERSVCSFCGTIVLVRFLGLDPLSWVVVHPGQSSLLYVALISSSSSQLYVMKSSLLFYNVENSTNKEKVLIDFWLVLCVYIIWLLM